MKIYLIVTSVFLGSSFLLTSTSGTRAYDSATRRNLAPAAGPVGKVSIVIDKSDYELSVYDEKGWYATYPVVFGNNNLGDKKVQGDKNTPEGKFSIVSKRVHDKWCRYLSLDYPTPDDIEKFNKRKEKREIPANASIGGGIGIHGTWPHEDFVIDQYKNWTLGCISMKNEHVTEIYGFTDVGTKVTIKK